MNILLTGGSGQLGTELQKLREYYAPSHKEFNLINLSQLKEVLGFVRPELIVHVAAYTQTALPEKDPKEAIKCYQVNVEGTRNLVEAADCPIIFISTESAVAPYNFYILTKMLAETAIKMHDKYKIIRTSFRENPFEYPKAATDMLTIADTVEKIAKLIDKSVDLPCENNTIYVGTGVKTVYELAKQTRPDVIPESRENISPILPSMEELLNI